MSKSAYFAGFIDGEGCIRVQEQRRTANKAWISWSVTISCSQRDPRPLRLLMERYGGHIHHHPVSKGSDRWIYIWAISGAKAIAALDDLLPYLVVKREQAEVAIEFWKKFHKKPGNYGRTTDAEHSERRLYVARMKTLKEDIPA